MRATPTGAPIATGPQLEEQLQPHGLTLRVYPDGAAPYWTVLAPAVRGSELSQWAAVKEAASEALIAGGATITHPHAVGRDHRPWYDRQRPDPFALALRR